MRNKKMFETREDLNEFTEALLLKIQCCGPQLVKLRDGRWAEVIFTEGNEDTYIEDRFRTMDHNFYWNMDGSSITSRDFDMVEFKE